MAISRHTVFKYVLGISLLCVASLSLTSNAQAQTSTPEDLNGFTAANGWDCDSSTQIISTLGPGESASCKSTTASTTSKYFNSTVACTGRQNGETGFISSCTISYKDGTSQVVRTNNVPGTGDGSTTTLDKDGNVEGVAYRAAPEESGCSVLSAGGIASCVVGFVGSTILTIANLMLGIAGTLLNFVVVKTVFEFGSVIGNSPGILVAWGIFRDLGNLVLLFGFIFMGLAMILNLNTFSAQKAIPRLFIFAVLMNFSLFAAEAVIDTTNAVSSVIYSQANGDKFCLQDIAGVPIVAQGNVGTVQDDATSVDALSECAVNYGIAGQIMQSTGLSTMWKTNGDFGATTATYIGLALFATVGAVVLFAAAIMLSIRLVVLSFLMVTAPIGFAGMAIPPLQKYAKMWWDKLISQSIFAPVLFLLIFVSLKITDSFAASAGELSLAQALTQPNASIMGIILVFVLVIGFMVASLVAARSIGAQGASGAINLGTKIARGTFGGIAGAAGRNTIGRASSSLQKKYTGSRFATSLQNSAVGRSVDRAAAAGLGAGKDFKFGSGSSFAEGKKRDKERKEEVEKASRKARQDEELKEATALPPGANRDDKIAEILERMSVKELEELDALKKSGTDLDALVKNLSPEKFSALVKDGGALSENQKKALKEARFKEATNQLKKTNEVLSDPAKTPAEKQAARDELKASLKQYSVKDLENAPSTLFESDEVARALNNSQRDDLLKNGKLSPAAARKVRAFDPVERVNSAFTTGGGAAAGTAVRVLKLNPKQIARLSTDYLMSDDFATRATPKMLQAIQEKNEIEDATAIAIRNKINRLAPGSAAATYLATPAGMAYWS